MATELLNIETVRTDGGTQSRAGLNERTLQDYADALRSGDQFPPIDVIFDGQHYWLYDGYHRLEAHRRAGRTQIAANIHQGDQAEAQWRSYAANPAHGLQRTQEDKERAIKAALRHPKAADLSDSSLSKYLRVSDKTVTKYRHELEVAGEIAFRTFRTGADGRTINTANIGANRPPKEQAPDSSDLLKPAIVEWLRFYNDRFQRTWHDLRSIVNIPASKHYADIRAYLHGRGFRTDDASLGNAIAAAFAHLERAEAEQIEDRIYRLQTWLIGKGWGIGANSISNRTQTFTWPDDDPPAHLAALKQAESIQKAAQGQSSPTSENPKSAEAPLIPSIVSSPSTASSPTVPAYLAAVGCKMLEWPIGSRSGAYKIYIPLGPGNTDSLSIYGPFADYPKAIALMDEFARGRGLLPGKAEPAPIVNDTELSIADALPMISVVLNDQGFAPPILPAQLAYLKAAPLDAYRSRLETGETVTDETLQAAIGKVEAALTLALAHCRHPAHVIATGRCIDCDAPINGEAASPQPAPAADREITETLDEAIRRAVCIYAGDRAKWQALAATGADYWQISDLLKACINSTGGSSGPGLHDVECKRGPIVTIRKGIGGPVVAKLIAGGLINAVRKAWNIPEPCARERAAVAPAASPIHPIHPLQPSAAAPPDERLAQARNLHAAIAGLLDIIDDYAELTDNQDAPAAATRVLLPMLNRLELMLPEAPPEIPLL